MSGRRGLVAVGAAAVLLSAYMHFFLYFWGGYRGISIDRVAGLDISRSFALNAVAGLVIAELLVLSLRFDRLALPAAALGVAFALGALGAYALARTSGLLGFTESRWTAEAVVSKAAELVAVATLGSFLVLAMRRSASDPGDARHAADRSG
ncbi:MAG: hypothetical protein ACXVK4_11745 [Acidimicrobiia bacterium]